jgi:RNA polymerase sigma-70 factor (ECF subfamily)
MGRLMGDDPFESMVAAHHGEIHRYLARVTARRAEADDLSQETFLRAFRAYRALPADANVRAWLFAIATNLYRNHVRGEVRRRRALATASRDGFGGTPGWPESEAMLNETSARIDRIIGALPFKQRAAFTLRKMHDLEYEAIGESLRCSAESARAHVFQALRKIRRGLDDLAAVPRESPR